MKKLLATLVSLLFVVTFYPVISQGAATCPDVEAAKGMLKQVTSKQGQASRSLAGARTEIQAPRGQEVQAPRGQEVQAPRGQEVQAPRGQEVQAPRGQEVQAPRGQEVQAPRGQEVQAPRGQEVQAPRGQEIQAPRALGDSSTIQAPRGQEVQAPRGQEVQAPRGQEVQAPRSTLAGAKQGPNIAKARTLIKQAEAACKAGKSSVAATKAKEAMNLLK